MKLTLLLFVLMCSQAFGQSVRLHLVGPSAQSAQCSEAAQRAQRYIQELANFAVDGEQVFIVCDGKTWDGATANYRLSGNLDPLSGFSFPDLKESYFFFKDLLSDAPSRRTHGFGLGEFTVAHELGHLRCRCDDERKADEDAARMLKDYHASHPEAASRPLTGGQ